MQANLVIFLLLSRSCSLADLRLHLRRIQCASRGHALAQYIWGDVLHGRHLRPQEIWLELRHLTLHVRHLRRDQS